LMKMFEEEQDMSRLINVTIGKFLDEMAENYPDNEALVYHELGLRYTYRCNG